MPSAQNKKNNLVLGIETSCDDTSVSLVKACGEVVDLKKWTADDDHVVFGGIIPERASRNHLKSLTPLLEKILEENNLNFTDLNGLAVTNRPGLVGSLIVGVTTAQTLSELLDIPLVGVNHLEGHLLSPWLYEKNEKSSESMSSYPQISLIVSGGHTQLVLIEALGKYKILGRTLDDAAGEALDKFSNIVGLGFPGGPKVDRAAQKGNPKAYEFPRPMMRTGDYQFSFSGLKAAGARTVEGILKDKTSLTEQEINDLCASYLQSAVDVLSFKLKKALEEFKPKVFTVVGGVSANSQLRSRMEKLSEETDIPYKSAKLKFCTDNGAMIALAGAMRIESNLLSNHQGVLKTFARSQAGDFSLETFDEKR
jgi:N6-L-threonylcarbamoyladenine synthase